MASHCFFLLGFCFLLVHELDAIRCQEWRLFPGLAALRDEAGFRLFTALHLPLYALLVWGLYRVDGARSALIIALDLFFLVHLLLHLLLRNLRDNQFGSPFSKLLFWGAGLCGALDLLYTLWFR
jgi:hypothetical protein